MQALASHEIYATRIFQSRRMQISPITTSPLSQCFNNHHNEKGLTFLRGLSHYVYIP